MKQFRSLIFFATVTLLMNTCSGFAQNSNNSWTIKQESRKVFIENKGQFPFIYSKQIANEIKTADVLYAYDDRSTMIYFTKNGVKFCLSKKILKDKDEDNDKENLLFQKTSLKDIDKSHHQKELEERTEKWETNIAGFTWENTNPNCEIVAENPTEDYFSYSYYDNTGAQKDVDNINGYRKITYKNLYPNIDVVYEFYPTDGIKYSLILHPGADISQVKMDYTGNLKLKSSGDLHISTIFGNIIDHAPSAFYSDNKSSVINSYFVVKDKSVSFHLDAYDKTKTVTIDPWTQTPTMPSSHAVMECERDGAGNVYIIGGESPMQEIKYNAAGTIQWTYNTPYDTSNFWLGTFAVDLAGNSYITAGSIARLEKVTTTSSVAWTWASGIGSTDEYWAIAFNCDQTKLVVGGTSGSMLALYGYIFNINTSNGSIINSQLVGYGSMFAIPIAIQEVRAITSCRSGRYYFLTLDTIGCIDQSLNVCANLPTIFKVDHGYHFSYKMENYRPNNGNGAIESIKANRYFVYTQNGTSVAQRSLMTGAVITSVAIPGGLSISSLGQNQVGNAGLDIDTCGNVYVGSGNGVYEFDANLNAITSVTTSYHVYDVAVSTGGNVIICGATGTNATPTRTGYVQSINMSACNPLTLLCCDANICPAGPLCNTDPPITLSAATPGGTWSGAGVDPVSGVFDPAAAGPGVHTIIYTLSCGSDSTTITVNACAQLSACLQTNGDITISNGTAPYIWLEYVDATTTPITTQAQCTACGYTWQALFGECMNGLTPVTDCTTPATWVTFLTTSSATITPPAGYDTLAVFDSYSNSLNIFNYNNLPLCAPCPTLTITPTVVNVLCFGDLTGSISITTTGGASPYTYTLLDGSGGTVATYSGVTGAQSFTGLGAGTYTMNVSDNSGCPGTITITITQPAASLLASISNTVNTTCGQNNGSATVTATGGSGTYTYSWSSFPPQTAAVANNLPGGTYTVTVNDGTCTATATATVAGSSGPLGTVTVVNETCGYVNGSATVTVTGGTQPYTYVWSTTPAQTTATIQNLTAGTYTVTVTDAVGICPSVQTATITNAPPPTITVSNVVNSTCGLSNGSIALMISGGTSPYSYSWSTFPAQTTPTAVNLPAGSYTVTVSDVNGCTALTTVPISSTVSPTASVSGTTNATCGQSNGTASLTVTGGTSPYTFNWNSNPPQNGQNLQNVPFGTYSVSVTDNSGCTTTTTAVIGQTTGPVLQTSTTNEICGQQNGTATVIATGGTGTYTYVWSNGQTTPTATNLSVGNYTVSVNDGVCTTTTMVSVINIPGPVAGFSVHPKILTDMDGPVSFGDNSTGNITQWVWNFGDGSPNSTGNSTSHQYLSIGLYVVTLVVTDNNGCTDTTIDTVKVKEIFTFYVPNTFSPNGDGLNDVFAPTGLSVDPDHYDEYIFNRWGNVVFHTTKWNLVSAEPWNGTLNNTGSKSDRVMGVYVYKIKLKEVEGPTHEYIGRITLLH